MDVAIFRTLASPAGQEILQAAAALVPEEASFLRHFTALSKDYPPDLARPALEVAILRREAVSKFPFAGSLYFTRPALEQASSYPVSSYRAERFSGFDMLLDLGCSVGCDTLSLANQAPAMGVDLDGLRLAMAQANLTALGLSERAGFILADLVSPLPLSFGPNVGAFFDPARRVAGRRVFSIHDYHPPLSIIERWLSRLPALGVKISPGVDLDELSAYDAEIEFISWKGELKEAVLWFGPLRTAHRRATVLPGPHSLTGLPGLDQSGSLQNYSSHSPARVLSLSAPRAYLYEPDPSILRAGLVQDLGIQLNAAQLDPDIAYLTADELIPTPFARAWKVETWIPFGVKRLREILRRDGIGKVVVKKRGSPLQPEELIQALHLKGGGFSGQAERVLFLTHLQGRPIVVICFPSQDSPSILL